MAKKECIHRICVWAAALVLATAVFSLMILMGPVQDTGDDAMTAWQLSRGAGTVASFVGAPFSILLSFLYAEFPILPWWSLVLVFAGWSLLVAGFYVILGRYSLWNGVILGAGWSALVWIGVLERVNFTRSATGYAMAGVLLLCEAVWNEDLPAGERKLLYLPAAVLMLLGGQVRYNGALLAVPYLAVVCFYHLFCEHGFHFRQLVEWSVLKRCIAVLLPVVLFIGVAKGGVYWSHTQPGWTEFKQMESLRSAVMDYVDQYPKWEQGREEYLSIGFEEADIRLMFQYICFADTQVFTCEKLEEMTALRRSTVTPQEQLQADLSQMLKVLKEGRCFWLAFLIAIYLAVCADPRVWIPCFLGTGGSLVILAYFSLHVRRINLRMWDPMCLCLAAAMIVCMCSGTPEKCSAKRKSFTRCAALLLAGAVALELPPPLTGLSLPTAADDRDEQIRLRTDYIDATPDRLYLFTTTLIHHVPTPGFIGFWEPIPVGYCDNYFPLGNWDARTPYQMERYAALGIENPVRALVERLDVYSDVNGVMLWYLQTHYGADTTASAVDWFADGTPIIQYSRHIDTAGMLPAEGVQLQVTGSSYLFVHESDGWIFSGTAGRDLHEYEAVWCSMQTENGPRTWRLGVNESGGFESILYGVPEAAGSQNPDVTLFALEKEGDYRVLGTVPLTGVC